MYPISEEEDRIHDKHEKSPSVGEINSKGKKYKSREVFYMCNVDKNENSSGEEDLSVDFADLVLASSNQPKKPVGNKITRK